MLFDPAKRASPTIEIPALSYRLPSFRATLAADSEPWLDPNRWKQNCPIWTAPEEPMTGTAAENYAGVALEFEFGWDKSRFMATCRRTR